MAAPDTASYTESIQIYLRLYLSSTAMRPLYAIAPLALLLTLFGPTPHEANKALDDFKARFAAPKLSTQADNGQGTPLAKPALMESNRGGEPSAGNAVMEVSYRR